MQVKYLVVLQLSLFEFQLRFFGLWRAENETTNLYYPRNVVILIQFTPFCRVVKMRGATQIVAINSGLLDKYINLKLTPIPVHVEFRYIMHEPTILDGILSLCFCFCILFYGQTFFPAVSHALPLLFTFTLFTAFTLSLLSRNWPVV